MIDTSPILRQLERVIILTDEASQARAYVNVTSQMGPCPALLAFINFDNGLKSEIGLECFDALSLQSQHEILLAQLNPDGLEQIALESFFIGMEAFGEWLNKNKDLLAVGGIAAAAVGGAVLFSNHLNSQVIPYASMERVMRQYEKEVESALRFVSKIPRDLDAEKWKNFYHLTDTIAMDEHREMTLKILSDAGTVHYDKSGWTADRFHAMVAWYEHHLEELNKVKGECSSAFKAFRDIGKLHKFHNTEIKNRKEKHLAAMMNYRHGDPHPKVDNGPDEVRLESDAIWFITHTAHRFTNVFAGCNAVMEKIQRSINTLSKNFDKIEKK